MSSSFYGISMADLIEEVEKYPEIWDHTSEEINRKEKRAAAWRQIVKTLVKCDDMSKNERYEMSQKIQSKWRNLRVTYVRNIKMSSADKYIYGKKMSFLNKLYYDTNSDGEPAEKKSKIDEELEQEGFFGINIIEFIRELKKYPEIWDVTIEDGDRKMKRSCAWINVAHHFLGGNVTKKEVGRIVKKFQAKWRNLRDAYKRTLKLGKNYVYAEEMSFIDHLYTFQSASEHSDCENSLRIVKKESHDGFDETIFFDTVANDDAASDRSFGDSATSDVEPPRRTPPKRKTKPKPEKKEAIEFVSETNVSANNRSETTDDNMSFFESLLPMIQEFDIDQKLQFRSGVLELITNVRKQANSTPEATESFFD